MREVDVFVAPGDTYKWHVTVKDSTGYNETEKGTIKWFVKRQAIKKYKRAWTTSPLHEKMVLHEGKLRKRTEADEAFFALAKAQENVSDAPLPLLTQQIRDQLRPANQMRTLWTSGGLNQTPAPKRTVFQYNTSSHT